MSHVQLSAILKAAKHSALQSPNDRDEDELLRAALTAWADQTKEIIEWIEVMGDAVSETRNPKQVMAMGSFRTHLVMSLKALKYSES